MGVKDLVLTPSHAMLTIHEIVAHATELDRILGYEANYAGTSFVKLVRRRQAEVRLEAVQRHRRQDAAGRHRHDRLRRRRREDAGVADRPRRHPRRPADQPRDGAPHRRKGEPRVHAGELLARLPVPADAERARRCRPGRFTDAGDIIADTKDGVLIDGRGSYSIDQQRYNGQFGGNCVLGDQERQEDADGDRRHLQRDHDRLLGEPRRDLRRRSRGRCTGPAATRRASRRRPTASRTDRPYLRIRKILVGAAYA